MSIGRSPTVLVALLVLLAAVGVGGFVAGRLAPDAPAASAAAQAPPAAAFDPLPAPGPALGADEADAPEAAVAGFLTALSGGDAAASYGFLSAADRAELPTVAIWERARADLPVVTGFAVEDTTTTTEGATVTTLTAYEPALDPVVGLVPGRARSVWEARQEDGRWRVALGLSTQEPLYPPAAGAAEVARRWTEGRVACADTGALEADLAGTPALAEPLCGASGDLRLGPPAPPGDLDDTGALVAAYGPELTSWARLVPVESPERLTIALAPLGPDWRVIGVVRST